MRLKLTIKELVFSISLFIGINGFSNINSPITNVKSDTIKINDDHLMIDPDSAHIDIEIPDQSSYYYFFDPNKLGFSNIPYQGVVISRFGIRRGRMHTGTDIKLNLKDTVNAAFYGVVSKATSYSGYGNLVIIDHSDGLQTYYGHLSKILVHVGDTILSGQCIGLGGRTGRATCNHLHFEIRVKGKPYDPEKVFDFNSYAMKTDTLELKKIPTATKSSKSDFITSADKKSSSSEIPSTYRIRHGDNLWAIARRYGVSMAQLYKINNILPNTILSIGTIIKLY